MAANISSYRGVCKRGRKWGAEIRVSTSRSPTGRLWIGTYDTEEDAARAYDAEARRKYGPRAVTNFHEPADHSDVDIDVPVLIPTADCQSSCVLAEIFSERDNWLRSRESNAGVAKVKGVRINCDPLDAPEYTVLFPSLPASVGHYTYNPVEVPNNHPTILPLAISKLIELPILVWEYDAPEARTCGCSDHQNVFPSWDNTPATYLSVNFYPTSHHFGYVKLCTSEVLAIREDHKVLLPFHLKVLCYFCHNKVVPLTQECRESSWPVQRTIDSIMGSMTKSSFQNFFHLYCAELMDKHPSWTPPPSPYDM